MILAPNAFHSPSAAHPPAKDPDDPYDMGDCYDYDQSPTRREWEINFKEMPYLAHIKSLSDDWRPLRWLADFMEVGTTPLRWKHLKGEPEKRAERVQRTKVTYMRHGNGAENTTESLNTAQGLSQRIAQLSTCKHEPDTTHILLVEDLSRDVIEILGSAFDIDPFFWREHIDEYSWFNARDQWVVPPALLVHMKQRQWFQMRHVRLNYYADSASFLAAQERYFQFNVFRQLKSDQNRWSFLDKEDSVVSFTRAKTSFWIGKTGVDESATVVVVLVDPTVNHGHRLWHHYANWQPAPSMQRPHMPPQKYLNMPPYEEIVQWASTYPWTAPGAAHARSGVETVIESVACILASEWLVATEYIKARLGQIEWELMEPNIRQSKAQAVDAALLRLHIWRRVLPVYCEMAIETLDQALPAAVRLAGSSTAIGPRSSSAAIEGMMPDFQRIVATLNELQSRLDRLTTIVTAEITIEDSRRGFQENRNLAKLTWLATTFIPLSFITGLFSMQPRLADIGVTFGWYFLTAVPLTGLVLLIAGLAGRGWRLRGVKRAA